MGDRLLINQSEVKKHVPDANKREYCVTRCPNTGEPHLMAINPIDPNDVIEVPCQKAPKNIISLDCSSGRWDDTDTEDFDEVD